MQKSHPLSSSTKAFTLLEILLVVAIIAILAGIVIVAINPAKQLGSTRDAERKSDINTLYKAVNQYVIDHGTLPSTISTSSLTEICNTGFTPGPVNTCGSLTDLSMLVPTYLSSIPTDPSEEALSYLPFIPRAHATLTGTGYSIQKVNNNVFVVALLTEQGFTTQPGYSSSTPVVAFVGKLPSNYTPPVATGATSTGGGGGGASCSDPTNQSCWSSDNITNGVTTWGPTGVATGAQSGTDGAANTATIITFSNGSNYPAAEACNNLTEGGHSDWYLPADQQLVDAYNASITGFQVGSTYWSSTENSYNPSDYARIAYMYSGVTSFSSKDNLNYLVRCLR